MSDNQTIFRTVLTKNFTTLPNNFLRDARLSFKARGLAAMVLTNAAEWNVTCGWLESQTTEGREAIKSALDELRKLGYATFEREVDPATKRFDRCVWCFYDSPGNFLPSKKTSQNANEKPNSGFPAEGLPAEGKPSEGLPAHKEKQLPEGQSPKGAGAPAGLEAQGPPAKRRLTDAFVAGWQKRFGGPYKFNGAADGKAADELLKLGLSCDSIMAVAVSAWNNPDGFNSKHAMSLRGLASRFNEIRAEVGAVRAAKPKQQQFVRADRNL